MIELRRPQRHFRVSSGVRDERTRVGSLASQAPQQPVANSRRPALLRELAQCFSPAPGRSSRGSAPWRSGAARWDPGDLRILLAGATANDPIVATPACPGQDVELKAGISATGPIYWLTGPGGRILYNCGADQNVWYDGKDLAAHFPGTRLIDSVGNDDLILASDGGGFAVMSLADMVPHEVDSGPAYETAARATDHGFKLVPLLEPINGHNGPMQLFDVDATGHATLLGTYPALPARLEASSFKLAGDDAVYVMGIMRDTGKRQILRLTHEGTSDVLFEESLESHFILERATFFTGP